jgi:hypothetical protein
MATNSDMITLYRGDPTTNSFYRSLDVEYAWLKERIGVTSTTIISWWWLHSINSRSWGDTRYAHKIRVPKSQAIFTSMNVWQDIIWGTIRRAIPNTQYISCEERYERYQYDPYECEILRKKGGQLFIEDIDNHPLSLLDIQVILPYEPTKYRTLLKSNL